MSADIAKFNAAQAALEYIKDGMIVGLGTGSTANHFINALAEKAKAGLNVKCIPTSQASAKLAQSLGLTLTTLDEHPFVDITVDGTDEIDGSFRLIKGGGGALLLEKIVASSSKYMVVIADESKQVKQLGAFPLPIEVVPFGLTATRNLMKSLAYDAGCSGEMTLRLRPDGTRFLTDNGNYIVDCAFGEIADPEALDDALKLVPGVVENGLFLGLADLGVFAGPEGVTVISSEELDFEEGETV